MPAQDGDPDHGDHLVGCLLPGDGVDGTPEEPLELVFGRVQDVLDGIDLDEVRDGGDVDAGHAGLLVREHLDLPLPVLGVGGLQGRGRGGDIRAEEGDPTRAGGEQVGRTGQGQVHLEEVLAAAFQDLGRRDPFEVGQGHDVQGVVRGARLAGEHFEDGVPDPQVGVGQLFGEAEAGGIVVLGPTGQEPFVDAALDHLVASSGQDVGDHHAGPRQGLAQLLVLPGVGPPGPKEDVQGDRAGSSLLQALNQVQVQPAPDGPFQARGQRAVIEDHQDQLLGEDGVQEGGPGVDVAPAGSVGLEVPVHPGALDQVLHEADPGPLLKQVGRSADQEGDRQTQAHGQDLLVAAVVAGQAQQRRQLPSTAAPGPKSRAPTRDAVGFPLLTQARDSGQGREG